jgi:rare lipoprotein A
MKHLWKAISVLMLLLIPFQTVVAEKKWSDVEASHPYIDAIEYFKNADIVSGYADGTFKPDAPLNRVEGLKIIYLALGQTPAYDEAVVPFEDLDTDAWYVPYIQDTFKRSIVNGTSASKFSPEDPLTREAFLKIVFRLLDIDPIVSSAPSEFTDLDVDKWSWSYIEFANRNQWIPDNVGSKFQPEEPITRSFALEVLYRSIEKFPLHATQKAIPEQLVTEDVIEEKEVIEGDDNNGSTNVGIEITESEVAQVEEVESEVEPTPVQIVQNRLAELGLDQGDGTYYADKFNGRNTANGEVFDNSLLTAAHPMLPFGTEVQVIHLETQESVIVRINDCGPFSANHKRVIDLSLAAFEVLGNKSRGILPVRLEILSVPEYTGERSKCLSVTDTAS